MGNYGNTMDRWYRRPAVIAWPKSKSFSVRAKASPRWALTTIKRKLRDGKGAEAREMVESLLPMWPSLLRRSGRSALFAAQADRLFSAIAFLARARLKSTTMGEARVSLVTHIEDDGTPHT